VNVTGMRESEQKGSAALVIEERLPAKQGGFL
jgi:hypothetical protein